MYGRLGCAFIYDRFDDGVSMTDLIYPTHDLNIIKSFYGALITRFFLGFVEAAFFPGALVSFSLVTPLSILIFQNISS